MTSWFHRKPTPKPTAKTKIQFLSDLHLEVGQQYTSYDVPPRAPILVLAGDIGRLVDEGLELFLLKLVENFEKILYVPGNHEFYGTSREEGLEAARALMRHDKLRRKLFVMDKLRLDLDTELTVLGCTLHSRILAEFEPEIARRVNDFRRILDWDTGKHNTQHALDVAWLRIELERICRREPQRRVLIVTHHAPSFVGTTEPEHVRSETNSAFCTDILEKQVKSWRVEWSRIVAWVYGHTHFTARGSVGGVRVLSNQRGYVFERGGEAGKSGLRGLLWRRSGGRAFDVEAVLEV